MGHVYVLSFATVGIWDDLGSGEVLKLISEEMTSFHAGQTGKKGSSVGRRSGALCKGGMKGGDPPYTEELALQIRLVKPIAPKAKGESEDPRRDGPFAKEAQKFYPHEDYHGGKVGDILSVVSSYPSLS